MTIHVHLKQSDSISHWLKYIDDGSMGTAKDEAHRDSPGKCDEPLGSASCRSSLIELFMMENQSQSLILTSVLV